jgi:hypothetical protein
MTRFHLGRGSRALPIGGAAIAAAVAAVAFTMGGSAGAHNARPAPSVPAPPAAPTSADQIQNIDQVKTAIKAYYGDTVTTIDDPVPNSIDGATVKVHTFSDTSAYAHEVGRILNGAAKYLAKPKGGHHVTKAKKAILLDVDDTSLNTYDYEIYSNFVYNPVTNGYFVADPSHSYQLRAVPHMVDLENYAADHGYTVFYLTGRPAAQLPGTIDNLRSAGYVFNDANVFTKDPAAPWLQSCVANGKVTCNTIQYKSLTRQYIESQGYDIVANFGDQYSDLIGGFADKTFKIPNPMYYLP